MEKVKIRRVIYGRKDTPEELREYTIVGSGSSAVGTKQEILEFFKSRGMEVELVVVK